VLDEQRQKLAEDNERLIYSFLNKMNLKDYSEYYGMAAVGLCRAAESWNPDKAAFSTYAFLCMRYEIFRHFRHKRISCVSLDAPTIEGENITLADTVPDTKDRIGRREDVLTAIHAMENTKLKDIERESLNLWLEGIKQIEIGKRLGISQPSAGRYIRRAKEKLQKEVGG